jgi:uncharacterized protein
MILVDTNVWLALAIPKHSKHAAARQWFLAQNAPKSVCFCRATQQSFLRLLTAANVMQGYQEDALSNQEALKVYRSIISEPVIGWLDEPVGLETVWTALADRPMASPKLWMDAYLAAMAIAGSHELATFDQALHQFPGLRLIPLT